MASRELVKRVLTLVSEQSCQCPAHSHKYSSSLKNIPYRSTSTTDIQNEYAFELATSTIRFGAGVSREVGMDLVNMKAKNVLVFTDQNLLNLSPMASVLESLSKNKINFKVFDKVEIEPTNASFKEAIQYAREGDFDVFLAVGGGSVMDTAKAANLYFCHPDNDFLDFVNAPIGKGLPITKSLKPLLCVPTTAGTGSETTGVAIFDYKPLQAKTGIANRALRPTLAIIDPNHVMSMPKNVAAFSGFDVLCHALESYTAIPFTERGPCPTNPLLRPAYQGSNPISDIWSKEAFKTVSKYFIRAVHNDEDFEARSAMHLASVYAGIGFGNAGVHLPHGMSYPISGLVKKFSSPGYSAKKSLVPHGLSVVITAPAVFEFTAPLCPERHLHAAELLGADITRAKLEDAGKILADTVRKYMYEMNVPNGIKAFGYSTDDIPLLVKGTLPQHRVTQLSPRAFTEEQLASLFEKSLIL